ncbi:hypothetical protein AB0C07_29120 [Actinoplanes missouriensis]|uniref:hypothetical protein n=1 Tax=Actinoplanes missouriensis TaxID=1866 RepID=UPI0034034B52
MSYVVVLDSKVGPESFWVRTNIENADLFGADITGTDLSLVSGLTGDQLACSKIDKFTKLPVGISIPAVSAEECKRRAN